jgi:ubiquinone/menaquinone biosynthesis C-methylase UbiE
MKDNFSTGSDQYAKYRPSYPAGFYDLLRKLVKNKLCAWDCGTGNGQVAYELSTYFRKVYATDISQTQLDNALPRVNIEYSVQPAEKTNFPDQFFDVIVVAQAIHWFDFDKFYREVNRTLKEDGFLFVVGYGRFSISPGIDCIINDFYFNVIGSFWDKERRYIDENYKTIPFPFKEVEIPPIAHSYRWSLEHLIGYLETWSAVKHFIKGKEYDPVTHLRASLEKEWGLENTKEVKFPLLLRVGTK